MTISSLLQNPFEMIPSSSSSSSAAVNLVRLHLGEVRFHAMKAAEVEESCNKPQRVHSRPINRPSSAVIMSPNASRLYSAAVTNGTNSTTSLSLERVFLSSIPVNGLSRQDAIAASTAYRLNMDLHSSSSSSSHHVVGFCFLPPPELADLNYSARRIPDLNLPPSDVSASELVLRTKNRNILRFIDAVRSLVVKHGSPEELAEYMKNKSTLTKPQLWNLDSIRIWNMLSLSRGGEIEKELVEEGLVEALIRVEDLPSPLELVLAPPHHYKDSANQDARIDYKYKQASTWFDDNKETLSSDARNYDAVDEVEVQSSGNYDVGYEEEEEEESSGDDADHHQDLKRKAVAVMDDQDPYDQHLQRKKARHGGALRIDEPTNP